jgi:hypothetical protein
VTFYLAVAATPEPKDDESGKELAAALEKYIDQYLALPSDRQQHILAHLDTFFALVSTTNLDSISKSTESLAQSSTRMSRLTERLGFLTGILIAETAVLIALTAFLVSR